MHAGDTIGALLNRAERTISYYKNGIELGIAFQHVSEERLYPCVGMQTQDEEVCPCSSAVSGSGCWRLLESGAGCQAYSRLTGALHKPARCEVRGGGALVVIACPAQAGGGQGLCSQNEVFSHAVGVT